MQFNDDAQLDTSQIEDRRGMGGGGKLALGGGGLIAALLALFFGIGPDQLGLSNGGGEASQTLPKSTSDQVKESCKTGRDANARADCRIVGVVNSAQAFWTAEFQRRGAKYQPANTEFFTGQTNTACGAATAAVGPFYCPGDKKVYIDLGFYNELRTKFNAKGGPFAEAYVIAHEYGHHVQNLTGNLGRKGSNVKGDQGGAVRVELQADCYAGVWTKYAMTTPGTDGRPMIGLINEQDIVQGLDAAAAVGDDRIQENFQGRVNPESWSHGSAAQRQTWFKRGFTTGDTAQCDTFTAAQV
jgi:predicted metalloprotease